MVCSSKLFVTFYIGSLMTLKQCGKERDITFSLHNGLFRIVRSFYWLVLKRICVQSEVL
jgi:hypothetical protein